MCLVYNVWIIVKRDTRAHNIRIIWASPWFTTMLDMTPTCQYRGFMHRMLLPCEIGCECRNRTDLLSLWNLAGTTSSLTRDLKYLWVTKSKLDLHQFLRSQLDRHTSIMLLPSRWSDPLQRGFTIMFTHLHEQPASRPKIWGQYWESNPYSTSETTDTLSLFQVCARVYYPLKLV